MTTLIKILLVGAVMLAVWTWPVALAPVMIVLVLVLLTGGLLAALGISVVALLAALTSAGLVVLAIFSPLWVPVGLVCGFAWLVRRLGARKA